MGIGLLLEGFAEAAHPRDWHGRFRIGDMVRLKHNAADGMPVVGRIQRFTEDGSKAIIAPVRGGPHVEALPSDVAFHTPRQAAKEISRQAKVEAERLQSSGVQIPTGVNDPNLARRRAAREGGAAEQRAKVERGRAARARPSVREADVSVLLEAFAPAPVPAGETPGQSMVAAGRQQTAARAALSAGWNAQKHPRAQGGRFGYTTGGKRAKRSSSTAPRTLHQGTSGALVKSIQKQLGLPADGVYGPNTKAAVVRFQTQHRLLVDGIVGRQTLAALRGQRPGAPGPIGSKQATVVKPKAPKAPVRVAGGVVV